MPPSPSSQIHQRGETALNSYITFYSPERGRQWWSEVERNRRWSLDLGRAELASGAKVLVLSPRVW